MKQFDLPPGLRIEVVAGDERIEVRRQLLFTLGEAPEREFDRVETVMRQMLYRDADEAFMVGAALDGLDNEQISAILTYVHLTWSEETDAIYPEDVQKARRTTENRQSPRTYEKLEELE